MLLVGCGTPRAASTGLRAPYRPDNIFHAGAKSDKFFTGSDRLPGYVKRVAILPLACDDRRADLAAECDMLQQSPSGPTARSTITQGSALVIIHIS